ncbi:MAG: TRM11 family SAM-dependent methyltransferase [Vicinamibacterales bacterium]
MTSPAPDAVLVFRLDDARRRARGCAVAEALSLVGALGARVEPNGPFGTQGGLFHLAVPAAALDAVVARLPRLGYTAAVERVVFVEGGSRPPTETARWKGRLYVLERICEVDREQLRARAPDRREFIIPDGAGGVRRVTGYRGDSSPAGRRGLPVSDARLLVNLAYRPAHWRLLDPFGGAGGVVVEALASGATVFSSDIDPFVMYGLHDLTHRHVVADVRRLPLADRSIAAIASEPPYDAGATAAVCDGLREMDRVLGSDGPIALMVAGEQAAPVRAAAAGLPWTIELDEGVDRKGLAVHVFKWRKTGRSQR